MKFCSDARRRRAQSSIEFAVLVGMFMVMFVAFFYIISERMVDFQRQREERATLDVLYKVQNEFNLALKVHDGYNRTFWLPLELYGRDYSIAIIPAGDPKEIELEYENRSYVKPILINLTAESVLVKGRNQIVKHGNITVLAVT